MTNKKFEKPCTSRREILKKGGMLTTVSIIASSGIPLRILAQDELPRLSPDSPSAMALDYKHVAEEAETRDDPEEYCYNCRYFRGDESTPWAECQIFPGMAVAAEGWCAAWIPVA